MIALVPVVGDDGAVQLYDIFEQIGPSLKDRRWLGSRRTVELAAEEWGRHVVRAGKAAVQGSGALPE